VSLAARVVALVAAVGGSLAAPGMPPAAAALAPANPTLTSPTAAVAPPNPTLASPTAALLPANPTLTSITSGTSRITVSEISPSVVRPGEPLVITGTVDLTPTPVGVSTVMRVVRSRSSMANRSDIDDWAGTTGAATGIELVRQRLDATAPRSAAPFRFVIAPEDVRLNRAFGVIPIAIELVAGGKSAAVLRTFVGWQRSPDYTPLSIAWLMPLTLSPDPALAAADPVARVAAWTAQVGAGSRLDRLLLATADRSIGYAVDPAVLGPTGRSPAQEAGDPASPVRGTLARTLVAASAQHPVFTLPESDIDVAALTAADVVSDAAALLAEAATSTRLADRGITVQGALAWPADGGLPEGREAALRAAYAQGSRLDAIVVSAHATDPTAQLTPPAAGVAPLGTAVVRGDDRLGALLARLATPHDGVLAGQEFVAHTAALLGERPSIERTFLVAPPRGFDAQVDANVLRGFLATAGSVPWLRAVGVEAALRPGAGLDAAPSLPTTPPGSPRTGDQPPAGSDIERTLTQRATLTSLAGLLTPASPTLSRWTGLPTELMSTRWRQDPSGREPLLQALEAATASIASGVKVLPQTTNFLADEGVVQLTVVNGLNEPVRGVHAVFQPGNGRVVVVEPSAPVDIAANAKATVSVRLAAIAQGLVPVNVWLTTDNGTRIGSTEQLTIRAAPPGAWLYVGLGALFGVILVAGVVRALRRPRASIDTRGLDPVDPTPEEPLVAPVQRHTAP